MSHPRTLAPLLRAAACVLALTAVGGGIAAASDGAAPTAAAVTVDAQLAGDLWPGAPAADATVTLGNPGGVPLLVVAVRVGIGSGTAAGCVDQLVLPAGDLLPAPVTVPAGGSVTVTVAGPTLAAEAGDDCSGLPFSVDYTADAVEA